MKLRTALRLGLIGAGAYGTKKLYDTVVANEIAKQVAMQTGSNPVAETKQQVKQLKAAIKQKMKELHNDLSGPVGLTKRQPLCATTRNLPICEASYLLPSRHSRRKKARSLELKECRTGTTILRPELQQE